MWRRRREQFDGLRVVSDGPFVGVDLPAWSEVQSDPALRQQIRELAAQHPNNDALQAVARILPRD